MPKNVNWGINQSKETFSSLAFISLFSFPVNVPQLSQQGGVLINVLLKISDLTGCPYENSQLQTEGGSLQLMFKAISSKSR